MYHNGNWDFASAGSKYLLTAGTGPNLAGISFSISMWVRRETINGAAQYLLQMGAAGTDTQLSIYFSNTHAFVVDFGADAITTVSTCVCSRCCHLARAHLVMVSAAIPMRFRGICGRFPTTSLLATGEPSRSCFCCCSTFTSLQGHWSSPRVSRQRPRQRHSARACAEEREQHRHHLR